MELAKDYAEEFESQYNNKEGDIYGLKNYLSLIINRGNAQGFIVLDYLDRALAGLIKLAKWVDEGRIVQEIDMQYGFDNIPSTLIRIFNGDNLGKQILKVVDAPLPVRTSTIEAGVFGSAAILLQAGVKMHLTGDFEITVDKTGENMVEVEVTPTHVKGAKLFADALLADAYVSYAVAQQIGQRFQFDLSTDSGRRAYQQALKGVLPGGLNQGNLDPTKHNLEKMQREFAPGVDRLEVSRSTSRQKAAAAKAGLLFITSGVRHSRTRTDEMLYEDSKKTSANKKTYTRATEYDTLLSGTEENGIAGPHPVWRQR